MDFSFLPNYSLSHTPVGTGASHPLGTAKPVSHSCWLFILLKCNPCVFGYGIPSMDSLQLWALSICDINCCRSHLSNDKCCVFSHLTLGNLSFANGVNKRQIRHSSTYNSSGSYMSLGGVLCISALIHYVLISPLNSHREMSFILFIIRGRERFFMFTPMVCLHMKIQTD